MDMFNPQQRSEVNAGRRTRLRQYQVQLLERMQAARVNTAPRINQLGVQIGPERILLELTQAGEIIPVPATVTVPLAQPWYLGLANIRGNLISIVDLARFLKLGETPVTADSRVVTFNTSLGFNCGLLVSKVYGLRYAAEMQPAGDHLVDAESCEWTMLDLSTLVRDPRFLQIGF